MYIPMVSQGKTYTCIKGHWAKMKLFCFNPKIGDPQLHSWLYDFDHLSNEGLAVFREVL